MAVYGKTNMNDFTVDELASVQASSINLECNVTEVAEIVNEAMEHDYNNLFKSVALEELAAFEESGQIVVYEEGKLSSFKDKVIGWLKDVWAKIKKAYDSFLDKMDKMAKDFKKKMFDVLGGKDNAKELLAKFEDGKVYYRNYDFGIPGKEEAFSDVAKSFNVEAAITDLSKMRVNYETDLNKEAGGAQTTAKNACEAAMKKVSLGMSEPSAADIRKRASAMMLRVKTEGGGSKEGGKNHGYTGKWIKDNYSAMVDYVCDFGAVKRSIKKVYTADKKKINDMISEVKKSKKEEPTKLFITYAKKLIAINNGVMAANMQYLGMKNSAYRAMVMKVIGSRIGKPKPTKESAVSESTTFQQDRVASLFAGW